MIKLRSGRAGGCRERPVFGDFLIGGTVVREGVADFAGIDDVRLERGIDIGGRQDDAGATEFGFLDDERGVTGASPGETLEGAAESSFLFDMASVSVSEMV